MWGVDAATLSGLWQQATSDNGGVSMNAATVGVVAALLGSVVSGLGLLFRQFLAAKDAQIADLRKRTDQAEARADAERERGERDVAAERLRTDAALAELREALGLVGGAVGHAERAVETVARAERRRAG